MTPEAVLAAVTAFCEAVTEACKLAQTPAGQAAMTHALENQIAFETAMKDLGTWFEKLFTGKL